jgi:hypothetical protein
METGKSIQEMVAGVGEGEKGRLEVLIGKKETSL